MTVLMMASPAQAYIGPGAGFAVMSSLFLMAAATGTAMLALLTFPFRWAGRSIRSRRALSRAKIRRCVIVGLDGMEPSLVDAFMARGLLPNLERLKANGAYRPLATTAPPLSPVAWSSFQTGCNPGKHNIFDFLTVDRRTYQPKLSSVEIGRSSGRGVLKRLGLGQKTRIRLLRGGRPFWSYLGDAGVFSSIIRVPITFPPEKLHGVLLSAMCVPDLRGSQGTFSFYTSAGPGSGASGEGNVGEGDVGDGDAVAQTGGVIMGLTRDGEDYRAELIGPDAKNGPSRMPFRLRRPGNESATLEIDGRRVTLHVGRYSDWVVVRFPVGRGARVAGICRFLLKSTAPEVALYVTPVQIDPEKPAMPIAQPASFGLYLAKNQGRFATLGLAEDTWGLNESVLTDEAYLQQCRDADDDREAMLMDSLAKVRRGLCVAVFDGTDRIQHMFWRYIDGRLDADKGPPGPNNDWTRRVIEDHYKRCDQLVGKVMARCDEDTWLLVISDHGFKSFRRGLDLNRWLADEGYLATRPGATGGKYLVDVDWDRTRAFALGLAGIYLNVRGREAKGIVEPGEEAARLRAELCAKLTGLRDEACDRVAVRRAFDAHAIYSGPYVDQAPDVIVGYDDGYRVSWDAAVGRIGDVVFSDNTKPWSGDHCVDPAIVPGVLFSNRPINGEMIRLMDIGPSVLRQFGIEIPPHMDGRSFDVTGPTAKPADQSAERVA